MEGKKGNACCSYQMKSLTLRELKSKIYGGDGF